MREAILFRRDKDLETVAERLISMFYPEFEGEVEIAVVMRSDNFTGKPRRLAQIEKLVGFKAWLFKSSRVAPYDERFTDPGAVFIIQIVEPRFERLSAEQKIAVIDHELAHISINETSGDLTVDAEHDIEEFSSIARRHGLYHEGLMIFAEAIEQGVENYSQRDEIKNRILEGVDFEL